jgi:hypothetical protein
MGEKTCFWKDDWLDGHSISELALDLVDAMTRRHRAAHTVASVLRNDEWIQDVTGLESCLPWWNMYNFGNAYNQWC